MFQINTKWHLDRMERLGVTDLTDPVQCAAVAVDYLQELESRYGFEPLSNELLITKVRRHHVFHSGEGLAKGLLFRNFVTGCTMLVRAEQARAAVPFCPYMVHDHYIALWCAACGSILSLPEGLIRYRIHGGNQTEVMAGVHDKESYLKVRIDLVVNKLEWLKENFPAPEELTGEIDRGLVWAKARQSRFRGETAAAKTIWKYREFGLL